MTVGKLRKSADQRVAELAARMARIEDHLQAQTHNMLAEDAIKGAMRNYQYEHETTGRTKASA